MFVVVEVYKLFLVKLNLLSNTKTFSGWYLKIVLTQMGELTKIIW